MKKKEINEIFVSSGVNTIIKDCVLKLFKIKWDYDDIDIINPISQKDYKSIRRSVRILFTKSGGFFKVTDDELKKHLTDLGGQLLDE